MNHKGRSSYSVCFVLDQLRHTWSFLFGRNSNGREPSISELKFVAEMKGNCKSLRVLECPLTRVRIATMQFRFQSPLLFESVFHKYPCPDENDRRFT